MTRREIAVQVDVQEVSPKSMATTSLRKLA